ncbi:hypothetical protein HDU67_007148 [Dinochytrium kinnereticum]|nr:hypothetical protein HDU67_007148 [Dinochytrium kinnereticum]
MDVVALKEVEEGMADSSRTLRTLSTCSSLAPTRVPEQTKMLPVVPPRSIVTIRSSRASSPASVSLPILPEGLPGLQESALLGILNGSASHEQIALVLRLLEQSRKLREEERRSREEERRWSEVQLAILRELNTSDTCGEGIEALLNNHLHTSTLSTIASNSNVNAASGDHVTSSPAALSAACSSPVSSLFDGFSSSPATDAVATDSFVGANWDLFSPVFQGNMFGNVSSLDMFSPPLSQDVSALNIFSGVGFPAYPAAASAAAPLDNISFDSLLQSSPAAVAAAGSQDSTALDLSISALLGQVPYHQVSVTPAAAPALQGTDAAASVTVDLKPLSKPSVRKSPKTQSSKSGGATSSTIPTVSAFHRVSVMGQKKVVEEPCACRRCGSPVATMILRGKPSSLDAGYIVDVLCAACSLVADSSSPEIASSSTVVVPSRKRARGRAEELVSCDVCRRHVGAGGVKIDASRKRAALDGVKSESDCESDVDFSVEVVCVPCRERYAFCTECGGGGKYRTGKYRPIELFTEGRRTCRLSHIRFGDAAVSYRVYDASCPLESTRLTSDVMSESMAVFDDAVTSFFASPRVMEHSTRCSNISSVQQQIASAWTQVESDLRQASTSTLPTRRYLATAYIPKIPRKKTRTTRAVPVAVDMADETSPPPSAQDHVQAAFLTAKVDSSRSLMVVDQIGARMMAMQSATLARDLVSKCLGRAQRDLQATEGRGVEHVCVVVPKGEERLAGFCSKLGAVSIDAYLRKHRLVHHQDVFGGVTGGDVFVISANEFSL